jgi:phosphatidylserine decarboxylase
MPKPFNVLIQYCCPQHFITKITGWLAECRFKWFKNWAIKRLIRKYHVNITEALSDNLDDYPNFNSFFTRRLKPELRPITAGTQDIASPADGCVSQIGEIHDDTILQAKGFNYSARTLLGGSHELAQRFLGGKFATIYLAPKDYHRVHMPLTGKLRETTYIPGDLFSVNKITAETVPNLFARNERLVSIFDTSSGPMAIILVGAMLVGHIETVWPMQHSRKKISTERYSTEIELQRGAELGLFKIGSTVIVLFGKDQIKWNSQLQAGSLVKMGEEIGEVRANT